MRITRIEVEGLAGRFSAERRAGGGVRIDCFLRSPSPTYRAEEADLKSAWKTWELPAGVGDEELLGVARALQRRCDGHAGTNSMVGDYLRELQRLAE